MTTDDDDMGEVWREYKAARQAKRADNRESSAASRPLTILEMK